MRKADIAIVTQKVAGWFSRHRAARRGAAVTAALVGAAVVLDGASHDASGEIKRTAVTEAVALPLLIATRTANEIYGHETRIRRGDTLASLLDRLKVKDAAAWSFLSTAPAAHAFTQLVPGRVFRVRADTGGKLVALNYLKGDITHTLIADGGVFTARQEDAPAAPQVRAIPAAGVIKSSLFAATDAADIPDAVAMQLVEIFSTDVDFHRDLRKGDRFSVVYEAYIDGESTRTGRILSAEFINQGKTLSAVWFNTGEGKGEYYTLDGRNIHKAFLRSPLEFSRISSGFSLRYHPILQTWRAHQGVDYASPIGTHIKATADGTVEFAGVQQGYGNVIILRHQGKYTTLYGHMQGFAKGIRKGARVQQGDVIGAVGMTGMTTGPHVHYEFRVNEVHVDPLSVAVPLSFPIAPQMRARFDQEKAPQARTLALLRDTIPGNFE